MASRNIRAGQKSLRWTRSLTRPRRATIIRAPLLFGSLARVRIDLPLSCDASFSLNVQKSSVIVPPGFVEAVETAADPDGVTFERYRQAAPQSYRNRDLRAIVRRTPVPGQGLPAQVAKEFGYHLPGGEEETRSIARFASGNAP